MTFQVAIVFRTPPYENTHIREATKVMFQLKRSSDGETSDSKDFTYLPLDHGKSIINFLAFWSLYFDGDFSIFSILIVVSSKLPLKACSNCILPLQVHNANSVLQLRKIAILCW